MNKNNQKIGEAKKQESKRLFWTAYKAAVYPPSNPSNPSAALSQATSLAGTCYTFSLPVQKATLGMAGPFSKARFQPVKLFDGVQGCRLPAVKPLKPLRSPFPSHKSRRYMLHFLFTGSESNVRHGRSLQQGPVFARDAVFQTPPQPFPRPQVSQVHATLSLYRFRKQR